MLAEGAVGLKKAMAAVLLALLHEGIRASFLFRRARQAASLKQSFHALSWHPALGRVLSKHGRDQVLTSVGSFQASPAGC